MVRKFVIEKAEKVKDAMVAVQLKLARSEREAAAVTQSSDLATIRSAQEKLQHRLEEILEVAGPEQKYSGKEEIDAAVQFLDNMAEAQHAGLATCPKKAQVFVEKLTAEVAIHSGFYDMPFGDIQAHLSADRIKAVKAARGELASMLKVGEFEAAAKLNREVIVLLATKSAVLAIEKGVPVEEFVADKLQPRTLTLQDLPESVQEALRKES